jgi:hypothetical protein
MNLVPCPARREISDPERGPGVYFCAHPSHHSAGNLVTKENCWICPLWREAPPAEYRKFPPDPVPTARISAATVSVPLPSCRQPCIFLGEQIGFRDCPSCGGSVRVKVFACAHPAHQETTLNECTRCPDHQSRPADL